MFMTTNIADDDANAVNEAAQFTPRYPVYNVDSMVMTQTPAPNPPQKRKKRRKKKDTRVAIEPSVEEKPPRESPVEI